MSYKLDPAKKPRWIDVIVGKEKTPNLGIYELNEDTLKICFNEELGAERSTAFESKVDGPDDFLFICRREKP